MSESMIKALADKHYMSAAYSKDDIESVVRDVWQSALSQQGEAVALSFDDAVRIARGCTDYRGGNTGDAYKAFQQGIGTVVNALEGAKKKGLVDLQIAVLHNIGAPSESPAPKPQGEPVARLSIDEVAISDIVRESLQTEDYHNFPDIFAAYCIRRYVNAMAEAAPPAPAADELAGLREQVKEREAQCDELRTMYENMVRFSGHYERKCEQLTEKLAASEARVGDLLEMLSAAADVIRSLDDYGKCKHFLAEFEAALSAPSNAAPASAELVEARDSRCNYSAFAGHICNKCGRIHDGAAPASDVAPERVALCELLLGGIDDSGEYEDWDLQPNGRAIEALQERLVKDGNPVSVHLFATPAAESVAQEGVRSRIQAALANKDHCDKYGWIHLSVNDAKALLSPSPTPAADTERDK